MLEKACTKCRNTKPAVDFHRCKEHRDGLKSQCKACTMQGVRAWTARNPERAKDHVALWRKKNKEYVRASDRKRIYGIAPEEFDAMLARQSGACAICRVNFGDSTRPHVDHSHQTGKVMGLLCRACNLGIGKLKDDHALLLAAARYIGVT